LTLNTHQYAKSIIWSVATTFAYQPDSQPGTLLEAGFTVLAIGLGVIM
jgi:hypothetical protein